MWKIASKYLKEYQTMNKIRSFLLMVFAMTLYMSISAQTMADLGTQLITDASQLSSNDHPTEFLVQATLDGSRWVE